MSVTVIYNYPTAVGSLIPPTANQAACSLVKAQAGFLDADTTITITHNFGMTAAELAAGFPIIIAAGVNAGTEAAISFDVSWANSVSVILTKGNAAGTGGTWDFTLLRPHSLIR